MSRLVIDILSDTHRKHDHFKCDGGDIIIHAGDVSSRGSDQEILNFINWFEFQPYEHRIMIPGNHDWSLERNFHYWKDECAKRKIILLNDSGVLLKSMKDHDLKLKVWGSPVTPWFNSWAFNRARTEADETAIHKHIKPHWDLIPIDTEILITHGPPMGILDETLNVAGDSYNPARHVGCEELRDKVLNSQVKLHVFGHIHEGRGVKYEGPITFVNAASLDASYWPADNRPMRIIREVFQDGSIGYVE